MREADRIDELLPGQIDALLIAGGNRPQRKLIMPAALRAKHIVAIDGGLRHARFFALKPEIVIGDLDSARPEDIAWARRRRARVILQTEQNSSDMDKALALCIRNKWKNIVIAGADGNRTDHFLYAVSAALSKQAIAPLFIFEQALARVLRGRASIELPIGCGRAFSWLAMPTAAGATLAGAQWPFSNRTLQMGESQSLSNVATDHSVTFSQKSGKSLIIIPIGKV